MSCLPAVMRAIMRGAWLYVPLWLCTLWLSWWWHAASWHAARWLSAYQLAVVYWYYCSGPARHLHLVLFHVWLAGGVGTLCVVAGEQVWGLMRRCGSKEARWHAFRATHGPVLWGVDGTRRLVGPVTRTLEHGLPEETSWVFRWLKTQAVTRRVRREARSHLRKQGAVLPPVQMARMPEAVLSLWRDEVQRYQQELAIELDDLTHRRLLPGLCSLAASYLCGEPGKCFLGTARNPGSVS